MRTIHEVSPALSRLEIRIRSLKATQENIQSYEADVIRYEMAIESINFNLDELRADERSSKARIRELLDEARDEGFDNVYLERFLKERRYKLDE